MVRSVCLLVRFSRSRVLSSSINDLCVVNVVMSFVPFFTGSIFPLHILLVLCNTERAYFFVLSLHLVVVWNTERACSLFFSLYIFPVVWNTERAAAREMAWDNLLYIRMARYLSSGRGTSESRALQGDI